MSNLETKRQKKTRKRCKGNRPSFTQSKICVPSRDQTRLPHRADEATFTFHMLWRQMRFIQQSIWSIGTKHSFPSLFLSLSLCVWALGVSGCDWVWMNCLHKGLFYHMIPLINSIVLQHKKKAHAVWILMLTLSKWLALRLQNKYGCVKPRHEISCKLLKQVFHKHAFLCLTEWRCRGSNNTGTFSCSIISLIIANEYRDSLMQKQMCQPIGFHRDKWCHAPSKL